ncbi:MAG TPA: hypothetical protein VD833_16800 [Vicinamibacterales bacterium]|nr:hypothetical protein [Vicinamibacterales bacterium]
MELVDTGPDVQVAAAEYVRLLGFPAGHVPEGRVAELAAWARDWYAEHGRPWVYARPSASLAVGPADVVIDGVALRGEPLRRTLERAGAHTAVVVAVSAGAEIELAAREAWLQERPDEYFFLEIFGSAVVEHLTTMAGARLCEWADRKAMAVLPHYSPGYPGWDVAEQSKLLAIIGANALPGPLEAFESGMLRPKKSLLAVFGITQHTQRVRRLDELVPCENCSYATCQFRRAPYRRAQRRRSGPGANEWQTGAVYSTNERALRRWAAERLSLSRVAEGIEASFRYDGTTCSNMGRPLAFHYRVRLGPIEEGYPIRELACAPAPGDEGYRAMCEYLREAERLLERIREEQPLLGQPLDAVLTWSRPSVGPGCYCDPEARQHKWGLVFETIHFALSGMEGSERR